uniref:Membrane transporter protein n=1 Tax=Tetradesmus obliquus TaxID=3088 RepID=A0A383VLY7_TETOB|eukprot:jgi/Sobl393_1/8538/SZX66558.1
MFPRALVGLMRSAVQGGKTKLKSVSELDPSLLAKARQLALGVGTAAGAFGSLVGVGGGVLIGPVILNACPAVPQRIISGTSLAAVATTGATAGAVFWSSDCVDARSAAVLAATAVLTAPFGAKMTHRVDCQRLRTLLGYWLYFVAPLVPLKAFLFSNQQEQQQEPAKQAQQQQQPAQGLAAAGPSSTSSSSWRAHILQELQQPPSAKDAALAATGSLAGFASGMLGIGGGTVVTPLLALATGAPQQVVLGTSLVAMVLPSVVGLVQHQRLGNVDWRMAAALAVGTSVGSFAGSNFAVGAPAGVLEALFAAGMLLLGRRTLAAAGKGVPKAAQ